MYVTETVLYVIYWNVRKEIKKGAKFLLETCEEIQRRFENNNLNIAYDVVKQIDKENIAEVLCFEDALGKLKTKTGQIQ